MFTYGHAFGTVLMRIYENISKDILRSEYYDDNCVFTMPSGNSYKSEESTKNVSTDGVDL